MGYNPIPATPLNICRYAAFLARRLSSNSIPKYLNIIRLLSLECGLPNPLQDNWQLKSLLSGIKRVKGTTLVRKLPITPIILLQIKPALNLSTLPDAAFWAASLLLFFGLLRKSNVLAPSLGGFDADKHLRRGDFDPHPWGIEVTVRWSKTIQFKERSLSIPLPVLHNHPLCPVSALLTYFSLSKGASPLGPAFVYHQDRIFVPLTYPVFIKRLRLLLSQVGVDPSQYAGHSFRRGGASWALQSGLPGDVIQLMGDWKSDAYKQYLVMPLTARLQSLHRFSRTLPTTTF